MEQNKVDIMMMSIIEDIRPIHYELVRNRLENLPDDRMMMVHALPLKKPFVALILGLMVGYLGIDRMYIGDVGLGVIKLLTCGGLGIWTIIDWFLIMDATKDKNYETFMTYVK